MADPSDSEQTSPPGRGSLPWGLITAFLVLLPVTYVLSAGPVFWLYHRGMLSPSMQSVLEAAYDPLEQIYYAVPATRLFFDNYLEWWRSL